MRGALVKGPRLSPIRPWANPANLACLYSAARNNLSSIPSTASTGCVTSAPMEPQVATLVEKLHQTPHKAVFYVTGGGSQALAWLLSVPGASNTVLEASVPYSRGSLVDILGSEPSQYCCQETAVEMAKAAYKRAANLTPLGTPVVGISATCSLATDKPKRGEHHAHIAAHTGLTTHMFDITLGKGSRSRWAEDVVVSKLILQAAATAFDVQLQPDELDLGLVASDAAVDQQQQQQMQQQAAAPTTPFQLAPAGEEEQTFASLPRASAAPSAAAPAGEEEPAAEATASSKPRLPPPSPPRFSQAMARPTVSGGGLAAGDKLLVQERPLGEPLEALLSGQVRTVEYAYGQVTVDAPRRRRVYLPGSFNPLHTGHMELLHKAVAMAGPEWEGCFELSVGNADKGLLALEEVQRRVAQFEQSRLPLIVTSAPLFVQKADLLPGSKFVVGYDTAVRLVMPKYHHDSFVDMVIEFGRFRQLECGFIVAGRLDSVSGEFRGLPQANVPPELKDLFMGLAEREFRRDISSTEIRRRMSDKLSGEEGSEGGAGPGAA